MSGCLGVFEDRISDYKLVQKSRVMHVSTKVVRLPNLVKGFVSLSVPKLGLDPIGSSDLTICFDL